MDAIYEITGQATKFWMILKWFIQTLSKFCAKNYKKGYKMSLEL